MSYDERDAWIDEKSMGDWPFAAWQDFPSLALREGFSYLNPAGDDDALRGLHYRLLHMFGTTWVSRVDHSRVTARLAGALSAAEGTVELAIEHSDTDAFQSWLSQEVWLPVLDIALTGSAEPAQLLTESLDYVGPPDGWRSHELHAAFALWCLGELNHSQEAGRSSDATWALTQIAVACLGAGVGYGAESARSEARRDRVALTRAAALARHGPNRANKDAARDWYLREGHTTRTQKAAAERIAAKANVTIEVAKRWVTAFRKAKKK